jgi:dTMP kinase
MPFYLPLLLCKPLGYKKILQSREFGGKPQRMWVLAKTLFDNFFVFMLKANVQKPMLISFSGIDGSGKSSYAQALKKAFEGCGLKTEYIWTRVGSLKGFQSLGKLWLRGKVKSGSPTAIDNSAEYFYGMRSYLSKSWRAALWRIANIIDFCLFYNLKVWFALLRRQVVICDRFVPDIFTDLYTYSDNSKGRFWLKLLSKCLPNPEVSILLDVPPEVALKRSKDKDCLEYLQRQAELYHKIGEVLSMKVVDTDGEFQDICNSLTNEILKRYYSKKCVVFGWDQDK